MKQECLYTTCLNKQIFEITGRECIFTFLDVGIEGDLFIAYEGGDELRNEILLFLKSLPKTFSSRNIILHDLDKNDILNKVLEENKDVIPIDYGGESVSLSRGNVPENMVVSLGPTLYFKYRASKWWRVFAALDAATRQPDYNYIIQIDADVAFVKQITLSKIQEEIDRYAMFYHEGHYRRNRVEDGLKGIGVETSFTGYNKSEGGYEIINKLMEKLTTKSFRDHERWDDSFLLSQIIHNETPYLCNDLIRDDIEESDVVERGPFKDCIRHFKGLNGGSMDGIKKYNDYLNEKKE